MLVACVDAAWTMKFFFKDAKGVRLEPANKKYGTIRPSTGCQLRAWSAAS